MRSVAFLLFMFACVNAESLRRMRKNDDESSINAKYLDLASNVDEQTIGRIQRRAFANQPESGDEDLVVEEGSMSMSSSISMSLSMSM